jgi:hypothetical protein
MRGEYGVEEKLLLVVHEQYMLNTTRITHTGPTFVISAGVVKRPRILVTKTSPRTLTACRLSEHVYIGNTIPVTGRGRL